jgi:hypothetical protein
LCLSQSPIMLFKILGIRYFIAIAGNHEATNS